MKIALLATGDELTNGDILNTNGQTIARHLIDAGFHIGNHVIVADSEQAIIDSIHFLQKHHDVIIITGGLGPTSDDKTRDALAKANNLELFFDDVSWKAIIERLNRYGVNVHASNKQQAYFPVGAHILPNPQGTAAGCRLQTASTLFFMLPGPPKECLPMFLDHVLPFLITLNRHKKFAHKKWRLFGVSEGEIAAELDTLAQTYAVTTGYRWDYPYLEFKLRYDANENISELIHTIEARIERHCICTTEKTASELLIETLQTLTIPLIIKDEATGGLLEYKLKQPEIFQKVVFNTHAKPNIEITGLTELWQNQPAQGQVSLHIKGHYQNKTIDEVYQIPFRNRRVVDYAVELIAFKLNALLQ